MTGNKEGERYTFKKMGKGTAQNDAMQEIIDAIQKMNETIDRMNEGLMGDNNRWESQKVIFDRSANQRALSSVLDAGGAIPEPIRRVRPHHALIEPRSTWRRERPYKR